MNGVILEKLPPLRREGFSYSSPSPFRLQEDKVRKGASMKDWQQDRQKLSFGRSERGTIFPLQTGYHRMAFNRSNCQANNDYFIQKDKKSLDCLEDHCENGKQISNRRQEKPDYRSKLEHFDSDFNDLSRERGETNSKSFNGYQMLHKSQHRLYENEIRLTKEIHKKEILLQEKLLKAAESLKKVQLRTASEDKVKSEEQRNIGKPKNRLHYMEKGNWDWESARDRALGGRRHERHREDSDNCIKWKNSIEREEDHVKETNAGQKEKRREGIEQENRGRNTQRTTKTVRKEWDHLEEMTKHIWERARTEKDKTRRERVMEWQGNEMREWHQKDCQKEIVSGNNGEKKRCEQAKLKRDTEVNDENQQWDLIDKSASNTHIKEKAVSKHDKTNVLIEDHLATQGRVHQSNNTGVEKMTLKKSLPEPGINTHNGKKLQKWQLGQESLDTDIQLLPCKVCNRHFIEDRLEKHVSICQKEKTKRQDYDSSKYRVKGTDQEKFMKINGRSNSSEAKQSNWRQKHEAFVQFIRQARAPASRGFQPSANLYSHYVTCPHCSRRFAPGPAERHIPKCQNIKSKAPPPRQRH